MRNMAIALRITAVGRRNNWGRARDVRARFGAYRLSASECADYKLKIVRWGG